MKSCVVPQQVCLMHLPSVKWHLYQILPSLMH